jgi:hypothetical protein
MCGPAGTASRNSIFIDGSILTRTADGSRNGVCGVEADERDGIELDQPDPFAVDRDLEQFTVSRAAIDIAQGCPDEVNAEDVVTIERIDMMYRRAPTRSDRQPVDCGGLREISLDVVIRCERADLGRSHSDAADFCRCRHIALEQCRRQGKRVGDVVETVTRIVRRQKQCGINVHIEEIANRVRVFDAIHPVQRNAARLHSRISRCLIEPILHRAHSNLQRCRLRTGRIRRGHQASAQLADDLFEGFGIQLNGIVWQFFER